MKMSLLISSLFLVLFAQAFAQKIDVTCQASKELDSVTIRNIIEAVVKQDNLEGLKSLLIDNLKNLVERLAEEHDIAQLKSVLYQLYMSKARLELENESFSFACARFTRNNSVGNKLINSSAPIISAGLTGLIVIPVNHLINCYDDQINAIEKYGLGASIALIFAGSIIAKIGMYILCDFDSEKSTELLINYGNRECLDELIALTIGKIAVLQSSR